jgi:hypothetical protein
VLDDVKVFGEVIKNLVHVVNRRERVLENAGEIYCAHCGGRRRVDASVRYYDPSRLVVLDLVCVQCDSAWVATWYTDDQGKARLALLPRFLSGGIATPHTPAPIAYYLDQAHRAQAAGANSAAVAMYRAALENILIDQGFAERQLSPKIAALVSAIDAGTAPNWAQQIEVDYVDALKELGETSIHPGSHVAGVHARNANLLSLISETVRGLLVLIYEAPHEKNARLAALRDAASGVKKR